MTELWVFGYGSLMWRPGFPYVERRLARLFGAHRALCVYSWVHRGTREKPGLVLGLDRGGACRGVAYPRRAARNGTAVVAYLREREQVTSVYLERMRPLRFADGTRGDGACLSGRPRPRPICRQARRGDAVPGRCGREGRLGRKSGLCDQHRGASGRTRHARPGAAAARGAARGAGPMRLGRALCGEPEASPRSSTGRRSSITARRSASVAARKCTKTAARRAGALAGSRANLACRRSRRSRRC